MSVVRRDLFAKAPPQRGLQGERDEREQRQQRGDREGRRESVFVVKNLDLQRHGVGLAPNLARDHRDRAELAHGARIAEQNAVEQRPFHIRQRDEQERLEAAGAE